MMVTYRRLLTVFFTLILMVMVTACGGGGDEAADTSGTGDGTTVAQATNTPQAEPTATPLPEPTDTPVPEPTATPEDESLDTSAIGKLEDILKSYRGEGGFVVTTDYDTGESEEQAIRFEITWVKTDGPFGSDMSIVMTGFGALEDDPAAPDAIAMYSVGDSAIVQLGDQWVSSTREESGAEDLPAFLGSPDDFVQDIDDLERVGRETISGVDTIHYTFDRGGFMGLMGGLEGFTEDTSLGAVKGDIWIAEDDNYVVKFTWTATAEDITETDEEGNEVLVNGTMRWEFELSDINSIEAIELPEGAPEPGAINVRGFEPGEFPLPADTKVVASFGDIIALESTLSEEEVNAFFDEELAALGWTKEESFLPEWSKGDITFTLFISTEEGVTSITIMGESAPE